MPSLMCLLLLNFRAHPDADVILGANRDEFLTRLAEPPAVIAQSPRIVAGRDLEAGGTWLGRNEHGLLAALTNRRTAEPGTADHRSRGTIVMGLLHQTTPQAAAEWLAAQPLHEFRPFNVLFGNAGRFYYYASLEGGPPRPLAPGRYALSNSVLDDTTWPKVVRAQRFLARAESLPGERHLLALQAWLCDPPDVPEADGHTAGVARSPMEAVLVESPGYGTVSSAVVTLGGNLGDRYYFAPGDALRAAQADWAPQALRAVLNGRTGDTDALLAAGPYRHVSLQE